MDYFNDVLTTFLGLERGVLLLSMQGQISLRFHQKYLIQRWTNVLQVWYDMRVINDRIFIFGWTFSLSIEKDLIM